MLESTILTLKGWDLATAICALNFESAHVQQKWQGRHRTDHIVRAHKYMKADCVVRIQQLDVGAAVIQGFQNSASSYICISSDFAETFLPVSRAQEDGMLGRALCS